MCEIGVKCPRKYSLAKYIYCNTGAPVRSFHGLVGCPL